MEAFVTIRDRFARSSLRVRDHSRSAFDLVLEYDSNIKDSFSERHSWYGLIELNATDPAVDLATPLAGVAQQPGFSVAGRCR